MHITLKKTKLGIFRIFNIPLILATSALYYYLYKQLGAQKWLRILFTVIHTDELIAYQRPTLESKNEYYHLNHGRLYGNSNR